MRTLVRRGWCALLLGGAVAALGGSLAAAGVARCAEVRVVEVSGLLDPVLVDFVEESILEAEACGAVAVVLQVNSAGAVADDERLDELLELVSSVEVPVTVWVGPAGAEARREAFLLLRAAEFVGVAEGSRIQAEGGRSFSGAEAVEEGLADLTGREASAIGDFIVNLTQAGIPVESVPRQRGDETRLEPVTRTRFSALPLVDQLAHTVASPPVAYLLLVIGLGLLVFELYTAGVGVAGVVGATLVLLGGYGLAVLPTSPVAVGLLVFAMFGFAVDVQTGVPRVWTAIAAVAYLLGSVLLYRDGLSLSWITLLVSVLGMTLAMLAGMPAMVRSRFSTPTIGREWMLGEEGVAAGAVDPDGTVLVHDAPWRARTNRATPIAAGDAVRVAAIDGLVLEVEPLEGAARDHRRR